MTTMKKYVALLATLTILLTLPAYTRTQQQEPTVLRYRGLVQPGDTFAPHLYDLSFNGVNQYAEVPSTIIRPGATSLTVLAWCYFRRIPWEPMSIVKQGEGYVYGMYQIYTQYNNIFRVALRGLGGEWTTPSTSPIYTGTWYLLGVRYDGSEVSLWINGDKKASAPYTAQIGVEQPTRIAHPYGVSSIYMNGLVGAVLVYNRALAVVEMSNSVVGIVNASGLRLFFDPTFSDGSKYIDLSGNGNNVYPYNDPGRVPAEKPFLWVVRGLYGDGRVRFRFVPQGWHVVVRDATGAEVLHLDTRYLLANAAGFVDEVRLDIVVPGVYEVVLSSVYPLPGEAVVGFGESLFMYSLAGACIVLPVVVAYSKRFEFSVVVSSLYMVAVLVYIASGAFVDTWSVALSMAGFSTPLLFLLSMALHRGVRFEPAVVASLSLAAVIHLVSTGIAVGYGFVPLELGTVYVSTSMLLWIALALLSSIRRGLRNVRGAFIVR
ncbi:MAG: LamG-like jellyroll fold domain-containing protein [Desulfurococcaceae archaeon]